MVIQQPAPSEGRDSTPAIWPGLLAFLILAVLAGCKSPSAQSSTPLQRIAFGSCINTNSHPMLDLLKKTKANGVIFLSGDRHWAEVSRLDRPGDDPLFDLTSSALTQTHTPTPNRYREGPTYHDANMGLIRIDWRPNRPAVTLELLDASGAVQIAKRVF
jgi:hypothetical protein